MEDKEKIENKNNCCGGENNSSCYIHNRCNMHGRCPQLGGRCHIIRKIIFVFIIIAAFCFGTQYGMMRSSYRSDYRFERGGMMGSNYNRIQPDQQKNIGSVTIDVTKKANPAIE